MLCNGGGWAWTRHPSKGGGLFGSVLEMRAMVVLWFGGRMLVLQGDGEGEETFVRRQGVSSFRDWDLPERKPTGPSQLAIASRRNGKTPPRVGDRR